MLDYLTVSDYKGYLSHICDTGSMVWGYLSINLNVTYFFIYFMMVSGKGSHFFWSLCLASMVIKLFITLVNGKIPACSNMSWVVAS